jgi:hypothetical protein
LPRPTKIFYGYISGIWPSTRPSGNPVGHILSAKAVWGGAILKIRLKINFTKAFIKFCKGFFMLLAPHNNDTKETLHKKNSTTPRKVEGEAERIADR